MGEPPMAVPPTTKKITLTFNRPFQQVDTVMIYWQRNFQLGNILHLYMPVRIQLKLTRAIIFIKVFIGLNRDGLPESLLQAQIEYP